jgi:hypothetical protein
MMPAAAAAAAVADPARHAALMLHAMELADQDWLLARLAPGAQERMRALLQELQALGIPADASLLRQVTAAAPVAATPGPTAAERLDRLPIARMQALADLLHAEPPQLAARLLRQRAWSWRDSLVQQWDPDFRRRVEEPTDGGAAPALDAALCEAVCGRMQALTADPPVPATSLWNKCRALMQGGRRLQ